MTFTLFKTKTNNRNPSFELLRLYATLLVIMRHSHYYAFHVSQKDPDFKPINFIYTLTHVCDGEFILLSGYFGCRSNIRLSRFIPLILQNTFYAVAIYLFAVQMGWMSFKWEAFWHRFFAMINNIYWFTAPFLISQVLFKPIYRGLETLGRNFHRLILAIILFTLHISNTGFRSNVMAFRSGISMFFVYLFFGCYLRFYDVNPHLLICILGSAFITFAHFLGIIGYFNDHPLNHHITDELRSTDLFSPVAIFESIFVLLIFKHVTLGETAGKVVNFMAECNYGIYTAHFNKDIIDHIMGWLKDFTGERMKWLYMIVGAMIIYSVCFIVEMTRQMIFNLLIYNREYYKSICTWIDTIFMEKNDTKVEVKDNQQVNVEEEKLDVKFPENLP